jgi:hypothetical protein
MEKFYQGNKTFICSIADYERIMKIHNSRNMVSGVLKNEKYQEYFKNFIADILLGVNKSTKIIGVEDSNKELFFYCLYQHAAGSPIAFTKLGESLKRKNNFDLQAVVLGAIKFCTCIGEQEGVFNFYQTFRLSAAITYLKLSNQSTDFFNEENRYHVLLHSIINPEDALTNVIEQNLLGTLPYERKYPMGIIHLTLKEKYRIEYFKERLKLPESFLSKLSIN